jgi:hypothetical protein
MQIVDKQQAQIFPIKKAFPNKNPERPFAISNTFPL